MTEDQTMKIPIVQCGICGHPVERWETWLDYATWEYRFRVHCHGEQEECGLDRIALEDASDIVEAVAFRRPLLTQC
jgi:hypothetical protein